MRAQYWIRGLRQLRMLFQCLAKENEWAFLLIISDLIELRT